MQNGDGERGNILLVDDDKSILRSFRYCLEDAGFAVATAQTGEQVREIAPWMRVVMATAQSDVSSAVKAIQAGAVDYLVKPCSPEQLRLSAQKQVHTRHLELRLEQLE